MREKQGREAVRGPSFSPARSPSSRLVSPSEKRLVETHSTLLLFDFWVRAWWPLSMGIYGSRGLSLSREI